MFMSAHDRQPPDDRRAVAPLQLVLEDQSGLTVGYPIGQRRDRELCQVQFILPTGVQVGRRRTFFAPLEFAALLERQFPFIHQRVLRALDWSANGLSWNRRSKENQQHNGHRLLLSFSLNKSLKQI